MSNILKILLITAALLPLSACNNQTDPGRPMSPKGKVAAKVNNVELTQPEVDGLVNARRAANQQTTPERSLEELIGLELLRQEAVAAGILDDPEIQAEINRQVANIIVARHVNDLISAQPITDEDLAAEYAKQIEARSGKEYKSSHILVKTEDEAKAIIKELDKGADFAELAKQKSTGPSGKSGGSLGWSSPSAYVPEFAMALQSIEPGTYSKEPVKTQFGWHIIKVEEVRDTAQPPLDQVKPQLRQLIMQQRITDHVEELRKNANVVITLEEEKTVEKPATEDKPASEEKPSAEETPAPAKESTATADDTAAEKTPATE